MVTLKCFSKALFAVFFFLLFSCQDDSVTEDNSGTLNSSSALTELLVAIAEDPVTDGCISLGYPVTVFGYNSSFQVEQTYVINSDAELNALLQAFDANEYYSVNYPVTIIVNGQTVALNSNQQLELAINAALVACDTDECDNPDVLTADLMLYMTFANGMVFDLKGNSISAPYELEGVADRNGSANCAVSFNGEQYLHVTSAPANALVAGDPFSISLWFKMQNTVAGNLEYFFRKGNAGGQGFYLAAYDMNTPMFWMPSSQVWDSSWNQDQDLWEDTQNWHHVVITVDADNTMSLYRDGVLRETATSTGTIGTAAEDYYIGEGFTGLLDDLRVYTKALTQQEVQTLFELEGDCSTCLE